MQTAALLERPFFCGFSKGLSFLMKVNYLSICEVEIRSR